MALIAARARWPESSKIALARLIENRNAAASTKVVEKPQPQQLSLPGQDDLKRAMPIHIARSSLFAPVARGAKTLHRESVLVTRRDAVVTFWGEQLDEGQADVWMQAMHEALARPLGEPVPIDRAQFLREIGRETGKNDYAWLHRAMKALCFAMLVIEVTSDGRPKMSVGTSGALHLLSGFDYDEVLKTYVIKVDPRWCLLYANREFAFVDWEKRLKIRQGNDMAKTLLRLVATSNDSIQYFRLDWLKEKMQYRSPMRKFKSALIAAMEQLERVEVIAGGRIQLAKKGFEEAVWTRVDARV